MLGNIQLLIGQRGCFVFLQYTMCDNTRLAMSSQLLPALVGSDCVHTRKKPHCMDYNGPLFSKFRPNRETQELGYLPPSTPLARVVYCTGPDKRGSGIAASALSCCSGASQEHGKWRWERRGCGSRLMRRGDTGR